MYTLLVIDMQSEFLDTFRHDDERTNVIAEVQQTVLQAIEDGAEIIDVNYGGYDLDPTITDISMLWKDYNKVKKVTKRSDGGGEEVMQAKPANTQLRACGINLGACVRSTVYQLRDTHFQEVRVVANAVANSWGNVDDDLDYMEDMLI